jgi:hypothetical protein
MEPGLLRVEEAAKYLAVGRTTMHGMITLGDDLTVRISRIVYCPTDALKEPIKG